MSTHHILTPPAKKIVLSCISGLLLTLSSSVSFAQSTSPISISSNGTPSYSMAIPVPPGIGGMKPNLGLLYSGSNINGPVGLGWTIQGISMITRCSGNKAYDGYPVPVTFGPNDKLCLDGQRLIQTDANGNVINGTVSNPGPSNMFQSNDSVGGSGQVTEYRTEKDMYARIRSYGSAGGVAGNGPAYFLVWTKSGQIYEYGVNGNTTSNAQITAEGSTVVTAWPVSRIRDTVGNYIDFQYQQSDAAWGTAATGGNNPGIGHEWNLSEVRYTGNLTTGQLPTNKVLFNYTIRPDNAGGMQDRSEAYHLGSKNISTQLLSNITTYINSPPPSPPLKTIMPVPTPPGCCSNLTLASKSMAMNMTTAPSGIKVKVINLSYSNSSITNRSLLQSIKECTGAGLCLPATTFNYNSQVNDAYSANGNFQGSALAKLPMQNTGGTNGSSSVGILTGNFFGSGRQDIIRWSDTPSQNVLYQNTGNGNFAVANNFNITASNLFRSDGCYASYAADFNGDGLTDILQVMKTSNYTSASCGPIQNILYLSNGDGTFKAMPIAGIDFSQQLSQSSVIATADGGFTAYQTLGKNFYLMDVNNDGILDVVTTVLPPYSVHSFVPSPAALNKPTTAALCTAYPSTSGGLPCTRVFLGQQVAGQLSWGFKELKSLNVANSSLYAPPPNFSGVEVRSYVGDVNGDGLADLTVNTGTWISNGFGDFVNTSPSSAACQYPMDFNGDGRVDCLASVALDFTGNLTPNLQVADGTVIPKTVSNFATPISNLFATGNSLQVADINGDGRTDIILTNNSGTNVYLSNGDGTFSTDPSFNMTSAVLQNTNGTSTYTLGDFTGNSFTEILQMTSNSGNTLYTKFNNPGAPLPDQLTGVTTGSGLTTNLSWVNLINSTKDGYGPRYVTDRGTPYAATYPVSDLTIPMYVVATTNTLGANQNWITTEYAYQGLKVAYDGRGWLGFRKTQRQSIAPDGSPLTVSTNYLQSSPYIGMANYTETDIGTINNSSPQFLSSSTYYYCDMTSAATPSSAINAPCSTASQVQRPYLYQSVETGKDTNGTPLPTVTTTNTFNSTGDPTQIVAQTSGVTAGIQDTSTKTTTNVYLPNNTSGTNWILGRLQNASVNSVVQNNLPSIASSAGNAPYATAVQGTGPVPPPAPPSNAAINAILPAILSLLLSD